MRVIAIPLPIPRLWEYHPPMLLRLGLVAMLLALLAGASRAQDNASDAQRPPATAPGQGSPSSTTPAAGNDAANGNVPSPIPVGGGQSAYRVGGGVTPPKLLYDPDPEYSEKARKARYQGTVVLWLVVDEQGKPQKIRVQRSLGMGLDEEAIKAVNLWRFEPSTKDGHPVAVMINVEVNFRLYEQLYPHSESTGQPPRFPGVDAAKYPLVVRVQPVSFSGNAPSSTANHKAVISEAGQQQELTIFCLAESPHCLPLDEGAYPARWQEKQKSLEVLG